MACMAQGRRVRHSLPHSHTFPRRRIVRQAHWPLGAAQVKHGTVASTDDSRLCSRDGSSWHAAAASMQRQALRFNAKRRGFRSSVLRRARCALRFWQCGSLVGCLKASLLWWCRCCHSPTTQRDSSMSAGIQT